MLSTLLLAIAIIALSVAVLVLERRVSALEKPFLFSVSDLKRANDLQSFAESIRDHHRIEDEVKRIFSR